MNALLLLSLWCCSCLLLFPLDWQKQFKLRWQLFFRIQAVRKVNTANPAVGMNLHTERFDVVGPVCAAGKVWQVKLNLVPPFVKAHRHCTNKRFHSCRRLIVGGTETSAYVLVVENLNFEGELLFKVLDDHNQEGELDAQRLLRVCGASNKVCAYVRSHDFKDTRLDIRVGNTLDMTIADWLRICVS